MCFGKHAMAGSVLTAIRFGRCSGDITKDAATPVVGHKLIGGHQRACVDERRPLNWMDKSMMAA